MTPHRPDIKYLFEPRGVAVIGASANPDKIGYKVMQNIIAGGYRGGVFPVNPRGGEILGKPVFSSLDDVDGPIDIAVMVIPAHAVMHAARSCARNGVSFLVVISSGFSEVGELTREQELVAFSRENGMRVLGPNIFGVYSSAVSLNATFGPAIGKQGNVAIITQSGAIGIGMIGKTSIEGIGLSSIVSVGNKSDITEADLLEYLEENEQTRIIMMYMEGVKEGEEIVRILKRITRKKPVIVIKSGSSKRGAAAAASHTGSLAGADEVFDDIMRQCGVIRAEEIQDALDWSKFLARSPAPTGRNSLIVTNGGGLGVLATDSCEKHGIHLYDDVDRLRTYFKDVVSELGSIKNPVDITGGATAEDYDRILQAAITEDAIHSVIALYCETAVFTGDNLLDVMEGKYRQFQKAGKPIVFSLFGGANVERITSTLRDRGVPAFSNLNQAISCFGKLHLFHARNQEPVYDPHDCDIDIDRIRRAVANARADNRTFLLADEAREVMEASGIRIPASRISRNLGEAVALADEIGYPVVLKVVSKDIIHKSDAGGVALNLEDRDEVMDAYQAILRNCKRYKPKAKIAGIEVTEMVSPGTETIIGARRDRSFGPIVMFGMGGIYVEVLRDVSFRALPLSESEVMSMIAGIKSYPLLLGVRGEEKKDIRGIADTITRVGSILQQCSSISDIEVNPLVAYEQKDGVMAVDARILLTGTTEVS
jgi:acetate---CoA ligase (ADP-forming)